MSLDLINSLTPTQAFELGVTCIGITKGNIKGTGTCLDTKIYKQSAAEWETEMYYTGIFYDDFKTGIPILWPHTYQLFLGGVLEYTGLNPSKITPYIKDVATLKDCQIGVEFQLDNSPTIYRLMATGSQMYRYNDQLYIQYLSTQACILQIEKNGATRNYNITTNGIKYQVENGFNMITCQAARLKHHIPNAISFIRFGGIEITDIGKLIFLTDGTSGKAIYQHTNLTLQEATTYTVGFTSKNTQNASGVFLAFNPHSYTTEQLAEASYVPITLNTGSGGEPFLEMYYSPLTLTRVAGEQFYLITNPKDSSWYCYIVMWSSYRAIFGICSEGTMFD